MITFDYLPRCPQNQSNCLRNTCHVFLLLLSAFCRLEEIHKIFRDNVWPWKFYSIYTYISRILKKFYILLMLNFENFVLKAFSNYHWQLQPPYTIYCFWFILKNLGTNRMSIPMDYNNNFPLRRRVHNSIVKICSSVVCSLTVRMNSGN